MPRCANDGSPAAVPLERELPKDYNAFLLVGEDGTISCYSGKIEMGQGIITSLVQMMADELNVPMEKIKLVMGDTDLCPMGWRYLGFNDNKAFWSIHAGCSR